MEECFRRWRCAAVVPKADEGAETRQCTFLVAVRKRCRDFAGDGQNETSFYMQQALRYNGIALFETSLYLMNILVPIAVCREHIVPDFNEVLIITNPASCPEDFVIASVYCASL